VIGELYIEGDLRVGGVVQGQVQVTGDVEIDEVANVKASVAGRQVNIRGQVSGPVTATKRLVVARSGSLIGDVRAPRLIISDGATFSGKVSMGGAPEVATKPDVAVADGEPASSAPSDAPAIVAAPKVEAPKAASPKIGAPKAALPKVVAPKAATRAAGKAKPKRR
jgi:cytoskeletal protein CcmA (bactofilin family)